MVLRLCFVSAARGDEVGADVAARVGAAQSCGLRPRVLRSHGGAALRCVDLARTIDVHKHARARTRAGALPHLDVTALHEARGRVSVVLEDLQRCIAVKGTENRNKALRVLRIGIGPSEKGMACSRSVSFQLCLQFE